MTKVLISLLLFQSISYAQDGLQCVEKAVDVSPIFVSEATNSSKPEVIYENLWQGSASKRVSPSLLPKFSLVETDLATASEFRRIVERESLSSRYITVKVKSLGPMSLIEHLDDAQKKFTIPNYKPKYKDGPQDGKFEYFGSYNRKSKWYSPAKIEQEGLILANSLKPLGMYSFVLNEDSALFSGDYEKFKGKILTPVKNADGSYLINECCKENLEDRECFNQYQFQVLGEDDILQFQGGKCNNLELLMPSNSTHTGALYQIYKLAREENSIFSQSDVNYMNNFEYESYSAPFLKDYYLSPGSSGNLKWRKLNPAVQNELLEKWENLDYQRGFSRVPIDMKTGEGPFNICHYFTGWFKDSNGKSYKKNDIYSDHFAHPGSVCAFLQIAKNFSKKINSKTCEIWLGHAYHSKKWDSHKEHARGVCFDVGSFAKDNVNDDEKRIGVPFCNKNHDKDKTLHYIENLIQAGAEEITLNPRCWYKENGKWTYWRWLSWKESQKLGIRELLEAEEANEGKGSEEGIPDSTGHTSHIHFCLPPSSPEIQKTCEKGLGEKLIKIEPKKIEFEITPPKMNLKLLAPQKINLKNKN